MKFKILSIILIIDILTVFLILSLFFIPTSVVRVIIGLPFLLFFPGYTLIAVLFVKKEGISKIEKAALSVGLNIAIVALIGLGLNYTSWGIHFEPVLYSVAAFIFITSAIALFRRAHIPNNNIFIDEFSLSWPRWGNARFNKFLSVILILSMLMALGTFGYVVIRPKTGERFTEFYILGINGVAQDYPTLYTVSSGKVTQVIYSKGTVDYINGFGALTVGITNHEQQTENYYVKLTIGDVPTSLKLDDPAAFVLGPIILLPEQQWENAISIVPEKIGDNQKLELSLYKGTDKTLENSLHFWINVKATN